MSDFESIKKQESTSSPKSMTDAKANKALESKTSLAGIVQKAKKDSGFLSRGEILQMQRALGNKAVCQLMEELKPLQRLDAATEEEEEPVQGKFETVQKLEEEEEEEPVQGKFEAAQLLDKEEEPIQGKSEPVQMKKENNTGMPDEVKEKMEGAFQADFSDVKVHTNSDKASDIGALAYTQGSDIHFAPGRYDPAQQTGQRIIGHELAHVVQQRQGRVQPTTQAMGMPVNDDPGLEGEADRLGEKAVAYEKAD